MKMIKKLLSCVRGYKKVAILTFILMVGESAIECMIPFITARLVNQMKGGLEMKQLLTTGIEDIREQRWIDDDIFIPQRLKENFGGRQLEIYRRFVKIFPWNGAGVNVVFWDSDREDDDPTRSRAFSILY